MSDLLRIIRKLWSVVYDLLLYIDGESSKTIEDINLDLDAIEYLCRPYAQEYEEYDGEGGEEDE